MRVPESLSPGRFDGRVCVVTGAARGIGRATAERLVAEGASVAFLCRTVHADVVSLTDGLGARGLLVQADVSKSSDVDRAMAEIERAWGRVDVLVNNAGVEGRGTIEDTGADEWDRVMGVNARGPFLCLRAVVPGMKARKRGTVVNVSSIAGRDRSMLLGCAYTASKAALIGFTRHAAGELGPFGITVNCVCPSQTRTPLLERVMDEQLERAIVGRSPLRRLAEPSEVAAVIAFLASDDASYMNGAIVDVNGGVR